VKVLQVSAAVGIGLLTAVRLASGAWLDAPLEGWNRPGAALPQAPAAQGTPHPRCQEQTRAAAGEEDRAVMAAGWSLVGPLQVFGDTLVVTATSGFDGMCRRWGYQVFVFSSGRFAGTLSPQPMNSRTDGAAAQVHLYRAANISAEFSRYTDKDPMCCPSRTSVVAYRIEHTADVPAVLPVSVSTIPAVAP